MITGYEVAVTSPAAAAGAFYAVLQTAATRRLKVREIGVFSTQAVAANKIQLVRPTAGGTVTTTVTPTAAANAQDIADAAPTGTIATAWSVQPTAPTLFLRQVDFNNVIGSGVIWTWPSDGELIVPVSAFLGVMNGGGAAGPILDVYFVWGE